MEMKVLNRRCAGLDVHKAEVVACARVFAGRKVVQEVRRFGTTTRELMALGDWLESLRVTHVAMEATGVYWKPVWHVLDERFALILANAQQVRVALEARLRHDPGRKSDVNDATWIADLLAHGLIAASFVPPRPIRELRDLTRTRRQAVGEVVRHQHRIDKILQDANIKLSSVLSDPMGVSGVRMLKAIIAGESDAGKIAELGSSRLECPRGALIEALSGRVSEHHRYLLGWHLRQIEQLEGDIADLDARIEAQIAPFRATIERVMGVPGVKETAAPAIIAEIGTQMSVFPSAGHLLSWTRIVPRLDESAGKKRSRRVKKSGAWLKPVLVQCARAAVRKRGSYYGAQYRRLKARLGDKKAIIAVAASILTAIYHIVRDGTAHRDLGADYLARREHDKAAIARRLAQRLRALGYHIDLRAAA
jgi:transposase